MSFLSGLLPAIGAIGGAALGSIVPGVGTALGASIGGSLGGAFSSNEAADAQADRGQQGFDLQSRMFDTTQRNLSPYMAAGTSALPKLLSLAGIGSESPNVAMMADPSYQWRLGQGQDAILNKRSALGGVLSGGTLKDLTNYSQGAASQEYGNIWQRLYGLTGMGENAAAGLGGFAQNFGNMGAGTLSGIGDAEASGIMGSANRLTSGLNNWLRANALQQGLSSTPLANIAGFGGSAADPWYG